MAGRRRGIDPTHTLALIPMKLCLIVGIFAASIGLSACVSPIAFASKKAVSRSYVGSVLFGEPVAQVAHVVIPLIIDYRRGEWMRTSGLVAYGTTSRVIGNKIEFSVLVSLPPGNRDALELRLPRLAAGDYAMIYVDPDGTTHALGSIKVKG